MLEIIQKCRPALSSGMDPRLLNQVQPAYCRETVCQVNLRKDRSGNKLHGSAGKPKQIGISTSAIVQSVNTLQQSSQQRMYPMHIPDLQASVARGQKTVLPFQSGHRRLRVCFGWNVKDARCDVDASAFLLTSTGRVPGDDWFVFYSSPQSPDQSVKIVNGSASDRQVIEVDLDLLNHDVQKIAFVLTINEAFENKLHFGMLSDVYIRVMECNTGKEFVSFKPEELFSSITSMTIAELYIHNGQWKFNPVGNGVNKDLAGQCAVYGVEIC